MRQQRQLVIMELYNNAMKNDSKEILGFDILCLQHHYYITVNDVRKA